MELPEISISFEDYSITRKLGEGDDALVYLVQNRHGSRYALKFILPLNEYEADRMLNERIYSEVRKISHPNIVTVYDVGRISSIDNKYHSLLSLFKHDMYLYSLRGPLLEDTDIIYILMEYIEGYILEERSLTEDETLSLITDLFSALRVLHSHNIVHGDLTVYNIMYDQISTRYKLLDFGLSEFIRSRQHLIDEVIRANNVIITCRFYPLPIAGIEDDTVTSYVLPDSSAVNKYVDHMNKNKRSDRTLDYCIIILSTLLGSRPLQLTLEDHHIETWQYGVEVYQ